MLTRVIVLLSLQNAGGEGDTGSPPTRYNLLETVPADSCSSRSAGKVCTLVLVVALPLLLLLSVLLLQLLLLLPSLQVQVHPLYKYRFIFHHHRLRLRCLLVGKAVKNSKVGPFQLIVLNIYTMPALCLLSW
jgi:hypothetical protein